MIRIPVFVILFLVIHTSHSQEKAVNNSIAYYFDSRDYNTLSVNTSASLPSGFKLWGFTDIHGNQNTGSRYDLDRFFMEYRILHKIPEQWIFGLKDVGILAEYNNFNGSNNDLFRCGPYISRKIPLPWGTKGSLQLRAFPYETESHNKQLSLSYLIPFTDRFSLSGFADLNFLDGGTNRWVIEPQLNYKINTRVTLLLEYRYNGFESSNPTLRGSGAALGVNISL